MLWHGNCRKKRVWSCHIASVSPVAGIHTDNMPSVPEEKAKKFHYNKKREKGLCTVPYIFTFLKKKNKNKSSSPQVKHNLTSEFSGMKGREQWNRACIYNRNCSSLFVIQTGIQKSNLNKTRLTGIKKKKKKHTVDLVWYWLILRVKLILSPLNTLLQFISWWLEYLLKKDIKYLYHEITFFLTIRQTV